MELQGSGTSVPSLVFLPPEPGPSGLPEINLTKSHTLIMKRQNYYPTRIGDQVNWLENFSDKLEH